MTAPLQHSDGTLPLDLRDTQSPTFANVPEEEREELRAAYLKFDLDTHTQCVQDPEFQGDRLVYQNEFLRAERVPPDEFAKRGYSAMNSVFARDYLDRLSYVPDFKTGAFVKLEIFQQRASSPNVGDRIRQETESIWQTWEQAASLLDEYSKEIRESVETGAFAANQITELNSSYVNRGGQQSLGQMLPDLWQKLSPRPVTEWDQSLSELPLKTYQTWMQLFPEDYDLTHSPLPESEKQALADVMQTCQTAFSTPVTEQNSRQENDATNAACFVFLSAYVMSNMAEGTFEK